MIEVTQPTAEGVAIPEDMAAYKVFRQTGELPKAEPVEQEATEQPEAEAPPEADAESPSDSEPDDQPPISEDDPERDDKGRFKQKDLPPGVQKRVQKEIDRAVAARKAVEAELAEIRAAKAAALQGTDPAKQPEQPQAQATEFNEPEPQLADFDYDIDAFSKAMSKHARKAAAFEARQLLQAEREDQRKSAEQKQAEQQQNATLERWNSRAAEARKQLSDFDEVIEDGTPAFVAIPDSPSKAIISQAFAESEKGAHLAYWMAKNPQQAERIAKLPPLSAAMELGRIEASLAKPAQSQKQKVSTTPEPPRQKVDGAPKAGPNLDDFATYKRVRQEQEAQRRAQRF